MTRHSVSGSVSWVRVWVHPKCRPESWSILCCDPCPWRLVVCPTDQLVGPTARNLMLVCRQLPPAAPALHLPFISWQQLGWKWGTCGIFPYSHIRPLSYFHSLTLSRSFVFCFVSSLSLSAFFLFPPPFSLFLFLSWFFLYLYLTLLFLILREQTLLYVRVFLCTQVAVMHVADHNTKTTCWGFANFLYLLEYLTIHGSRVLHVLLICYCLLSPSLPTQFIYYLPLISSHAVRLNSLSLRPAPPLSPLGEFALKQPPQFFGFFFFYNEVVIAGYQPAISVCDLSQFLSFLYLFLSFFFSF